MKSLREELLAYHKWLIQEMLVDTDDDSEFTVDNYLEAINYDAQDESPTVGDNEDQVKHSSHSRSSSRAIIGGVEHWQCYWCKGWFKCD